MRLEGIPKGFCQCGCGQKTNLAPQSYAARGYVKGEPYPFVAGHGNRKNIPPVLDPETGCLLWQKCLWNGYGSDRQGKPAHRTAWIERYGPIPEGMDLHHKCGVRHCVNPDHLELLSHGEHSRLHGGPTAPRKYSDDVVREVRYLADQGWVVTDVANAYGMSWPTAHQVVHRTIRRNVQ
jgi:hypothetical protein